MKKVLSLLLVLVLALGMSSIAFAAPTIDVTQTADLTRAFDAQQSAAGSSVRAAQDRDPGDELYLYLNSGMFSASTTATQFASGGVTMNEARKAKITLRAKIAAGSKVLDSYELVDKNKTAAIKIVFVDPFRSIDDTDFDFTFYLVIDGDRYDDNGLVLSGNMENDLISVYEDDDYVNIEDGQVIDGEEYNKKIEVDLGFGVSVWAKVFKDRKYWGVADNEPTEADDVVMAKYGFSEVRTVDTINLQSVCQYVKLNDVDASYYVYGYKDGSKEISYLGKSNEELVYSTKYYLASKEVTLDNDDSTEPTDETDEGDVDEIDVPESGPNSGGDSNYPSNINDNPGTGR